GRRIRRRRRWPEWHCCGQEVAFPGASLSVTSQSPSAAQTSRGQQRVATSTKEAHILSGLSDLRQRTNPRLRRFSSYPYIRAKRRGIGSPACKPPRRSHLLTTARPQKSR